MRLQAKGLGDATNMLVSSNGIVPGGVVHSSTSGYVEEQNRVRSQVVVASFTNYTLHKEPMIPVILMCKRIMCVCLYHCTSDILLFSDQLPLDEVGVALLWSILNYRYVAHYKHVSTYFYALHTLQEFCTGSFVPKRLCLKNSLLVGSRRQ